MRIFWCHFKLLSHLKRFPHEEHKCGFTSAWLFRCICKCDGKRNVLLHWSQLNCLPPERTCFWFFKLLLFLGLLPLAEHCSFFPCVCKWRFRSFLYVKLLLHWRHVKGFSPVWSLVWNRRLMFWLKLFPVQVKGFSPVWILMWILKCPLNLKLFPQSWHVKVFREWILSCQVRCLLSGNLCPHWWHLYSFEWSPMW